MYLDELYIFKTQKQLVIQRLWPITHSHKTNNNPTISPTQGKTVFFKSNELEYEVLETNERIMSVNGWLKWG
jgi:Rps23 Pro-64 3,4-dihydroxylase Tpa1-like proline 4-hydroxylase